MITDALPLDGTTYMLGSIAALWAVVIMAAAGYALKRWWSARQP